MRKAIIAVVAATAAALAAGLAGPAPAQTREITRVAGDVYRFRNDFHNSVFVITSDGVVVTDPINADAAAWLADQIAVMTDKPIRYLVYSHSHPDHASGGAIFARQATTIAQDNAPETIDGVKIDRRFEEKMGFSLGDHRFELTWLGVGHGIDLAAMVIRPENVAFVVDAVSVDRLPYRDFPGAEVGGILYQIKVVEGLDFDILVGGHGPVGAKQDVVEQRRYMDRLLYLVREGLQEGLDVDTMVRRFTLDEYRDWQGYDEWRELNIRGAARWFQEGGAMK